jgi:hypothetical protein
MKRPLKVLVLTEQPLLAEMVKLTLDHGIFVTHCVLHVNEAFKLLDDWQSELIGVFSDQTTA